MEQLNKRLNELLDEAIELDKNLLTTLPKSILQEAIQGKLVSQQPEEGTAEELLAEIRKEKELLVKEGKLKKSALTDSVIFKGDDNKYSITSIGRRLEKKFVVLMMKYLLKFLKLGRG